MSVGHHLGADEQTGLLVSLATEGLGPEQSQWAAT